MRPWRVCGCITPKAKSKTSIRNSVIESAIRQVSAFAILDELSLGLRKARSAEKRLARMASNKVMISSFVNMDAVSNK